MSPCRSEGWNRYGVCRKTAQLSNRVPRRALRVVTPCVTIGFGSVGGPLVDSTAVLRFLTAGESHGKALVVVVEGLPAGLAVSVADIDAELARRRLGYRRRPRMRFEQDVVTLVGGVRHGRTLGSPVAIG